MIQFEAATERNFTPHSDVWPVRGGVWHADRGLRGTGGELVGNFECSPHALTCSPHNKQPCTPQSEGSRVPDLATLQALSTGNQRGIQDELGSKGNQRKSTGNQKGSETGGRGNQNEMKRRSTGNQNRKKVKRNHKKSTGNQRV